MNGTLHEIDLTPPDLDRYRQGNAGLDYVTTWTGPAPGPHVVVNALIHGNELCGAVALDQLVRLGVRPARGRLTFVFANVAACRAFDPANPLLARFLDEDMNRLWDPAVLDGARRSIELDRARALRPVYETADYLLDLHSMQNPGEPLTLCGMTARGRALARAIGYPRWIVADAGHAAGRRLLDHPRFGTPGPAGPTALLIECGQHREARSARVASEVTLRLLHHLDMVDPELAASVVGTGPAAPQHLVEVTDAVTATTDRFTYLVDHAGLDVIGRAGTLIARDGGREIRTPYDDCVLIMPARRLRRGQTAVRLGRLARP